MFKDTDHSFFSSQTQQSEKNNVTDSNSSKVPSDPVTGKIPYYLIIDHVSNKAKQLDESFDFEFVNRYTFKLNKLFSSRGEAVSCCQKLAANDIENQSAYTVSNPQTSGTYRVMLKVSRLKHATFSDKQIHQQAQQPLMESFDLAKELHQAPKAPTKSLDFVKEPHQAPEDSTGSFDFELAKNHVINKAKQLGSNNLCYSFEVLNNSQLQSVLGHIHKGADRAVQICSELAANDEKNKDAYYIVDRQPVLRIIVDLWKVKDYSEFLSLEQAQQSSETNLKL
jgi:hypothetical protein